MYKSIIDRLDINTCIGKESEREREKIIMNSAVAAVCLFPVVVTFDDDIDDWYYPFLFSLLLSLDLYECKKRYR
jgi:hypothetical protein